MCITIKNGSVCLGNSHVINMKRFTKLYEGFVGKGTGKDTAKIEEEGTSLLLKDNLSDEKRIKSTNEFARRVFRWGGPTGNIVHWMVYHKRGNKNEAEDKVKEVVTNLAELLRDAKLKSAFDEEFSNALNEALKEVTSIYGLDISYGSKILRMLLPEKAGAYDCILQEKFPLYLKSGYAKFCGDCKEVAVALEKRDIKNKSIHRKNEEWFVADVEAAIFHYFECEKNKIKAKAETKYA